MEAAFAVMKTTVEKASGDASKARSIADGASSLSGVLNKTVDAMSKKVNKLEDKVFR